MAEAEALKARFVITIDAVVVVVVDVVDVVDVGVGVVAIAD